MGHLPEKLRNNWNNNLHGHTGPLFILPENYNYEDRRIIYDNMLTVIFVRNPFSRILSTYKDKIIDKKYLNWRVKILEFGKQLNMVCNKTKLFA